VLPRSTLLRFLLAVSAILLLSLAAYLGFGWVLWTRQPWILSSGLGSERLNHLALAYARAWGGIASADSDGDGPSDGFEAYLQTDPHDAADYPELSLYSAVTCKNPDTGFAARPAVVLQPGERRLIRARFRSWGDRVVFGTGTQFLMSLGLNNPGLICLPGGTPSKAPFRIPITTDGILEFELSLPPGTEPTDPAKPAEVHLEASREGFIVAILDYSCQGKGIAVACEVQHLSTVGLWSRVLVNRPVDSPSGSLLIEAGGASGEQWFLVGLIRPEEKSVIFTYSLDDVDPRIRGPLQFRAVPIQTPPTK
jgi:hypothetical protein